MPQDNPSYEQILDAVEALNDGLATHGLRFVTMDEAEPAMDTLQQTLKKFHMHRDEHTHGLDRKELLKQARLDHGSDELEFDEEAEFSVGDDPGVWIQGWVWLPSFKRQKPELVTAKGTVVKLADFKEIPSIKDDDK